MRSVSSHPLDETQGLQQPLRSHMPVTYLRARRDHGRHGCDYDLRGRDGA